MSRILLSALLLCSFQFCNATVSNVLGVSKLTIPAGNVPIASAYVHPKELGFSVDGAALSVDELTIDLPSASIVAGDYNESVYPLYYVEVTESGSYEGMYFDVISNTASSITIKTWTAATDPTQPIGANTTVILRKHMTIDDFFSDAESQFSAFTEVLKFILPDGGSITVFWDGAKWTMDSVNDDGTMPIYPGQGFLVGFPVARTFNVIGEVKSTPTQVPVYPGSNNFVGTFSPIDESFNSLNTFAWMDPFLDVFKLFAVDGSLATTGTFFSDGSKVTSDGASDDGDEVLGAHSAFLLGTAFEGNWIIPPAYPVN